MFRGGIEFKIEGEAQSISPPKDDKPGGVALAWFGGNIYLRFGDATQAGKFEEGKLYRVICSAREFKGDRYPAEIVSVEPIKATS